MLLQMGRIGQLAFLPFIFNAFPLLFHSNPRATVEREVFDVLRPLVFEVFTPPSVVAGTRDKLEQLLKELWWPPSPGKPSPFEQRYEGFGCDMAVAVLNLFQASADTSLWIRYFSSHFFARFPLLLSVLLPKLHCTKIAKLGLQPLHLRKKEKTPVAVPRHHQNIASYQFLLANPNAFVLYPWATHPQVL